MILLSNKKLSIYFLRLLNLFAANVFITLTLYFHLFQDFILKKSKYIFANRIRSLENRLSIVFILSKEIKHRLNQILFRLRLK